MQNNLLCTFIHQKSNFFGGLSPQTMTPACSMQWSGIIHTRKESAQSNQTPLYDWSSHATTWATATVGHNTTAADKRNESQQSSQITSQNTTLTLNMISKMIKLEYCLRGPNAISLITWKIVLGSIPLSLNLCLQSRTWFPYSGLTAGFLITVLLKERNLLFKQGLYCWENTNIVTTVVLMIQKN